MNKQPEAITFNQYRERPKQSFFDEAWEPLMYTDATPDDEYVLRILKAHLANCDGVKWASNVPLAFVDAMNESSRKRAELLKEAIKKITPPSQLENKDQ